MTEHDERFPDRLGANDGPCRVVAIDMAADTSGAVVSGRRDADGVLHIDGIGVSIEDVTRWTQAMAPPFQQFHEQMRRILEAVGVSLRPLVEFLEQHPEVRDMQPEPPVQGCHHLCGSWPEHDCAGGATGTPAYLPGGREVPMCDGCRAVTLARPPPAERADDWDWPAQGSTCAHVCGGDADHRCDARAVTSIRFPIPSGGQRTLPLCGPCHQAETSTASVAS